MPTKVIVDGEEYVKVPKKTNIHFILDKSGSMGEIQDSTISAVNEYIDSLKKDGQDYSFALTLFDTEVTTKDPRPLSKVVKLTRLSYQPYGNTALYDAVCKTLHEVKNQKGKNLVIIMTDGEENSSREYTEDNFKTLKSQLEEKGNWSFVFLGANQDVWAFAHKFGFARHNTTVFNATPKGMGTAMGNLSASTTNYAMHAGAATDNMFTPQQQEQNEAAK